MAQIQNFLNLRRRLIRRDYVINRALVYSSLVLLVTIGYALMVSGLGMIFYQVIPYRNPVFVGLIIFLIAIAILPLRIQLEKTIDALFFRGAKVYQERLQDFSSELTGAVGLIEIIKLVRQYIEKSLSPSTLHLFLYDSLSDEYLATLDETGSATSDIRFLAKGQFAQLLNTQNEPRVFTESDFSSKQLQPELTRIRLLNTQLFSPLMGQERLAGWIAMGANINGKPYSSRELVFLDAISDQAAVAIERAQVMTKMEDRVREMNVLTLVAQGINITLSLDDILELIYAQTSQIIASDDFHILLRDMQSEILSDIFYIENDERLQHLEKKPIPGGPSLEQEVIRQRRSIITDDYALECKLHGFPVNRQNIFAWLAVPLNAGAETIGMLSLGSRDGSLRYTIDQLNLLQAIADQAAGAIIKTRLLEETQRRERHLSSLNEVARQLTSTLEVEPLLQNIMKSAIDILSCEAGSLLLVDDQTDDYVFKVTLGPAARDLINRRLPSGSGLIGKSVLARQPIIVNDVQSSPEWFSKTDEQTGFITRAILVVPLILLDKVIGVIEVINKMDGASFSNDDQDLLTAFAAQAVIAIENARLYTMTDQALAARVEELSVMQRIGRELNTSLDITRAMTITLDWAMRQTGSEAGLVGLVESEHLRIMAFQGYSDELSSYNDLLIPLDERNFQEVIAGGLPKWFSFPEGKGGLLKGSKNQAITPIQREQKTIGILMLESTINNPDFEDVLGFLQRLSDHASIAIANAQLYAAVQAANLAKSEFVSFVSHELKNPMTSIKGYTELLAAGAVGPVNEPQTNFLTTIKSNVERMAILVSDLTDLSRIEANRLKLDFKALKPREILDEIVRSMRRQIDERNQELIIQYPDDLPDVWGDRTRLIQVMTNLVSNAHKYTPSGGRLLAAAEASDNSWDENGAPKVVHLWVTDTGLGISPEDQKKIFQKFFRSEDPKAREAPGTGLGLNITKSLVELQGGRIWFQSEYRTGTTFHFTIPVAG